MFNSRGTFLRYLHALRLLSVVAAPFALRTPAFADASRPVTETELAQRLGFYRQISSLQVPFRQVKWMKEMDLKLRSEGRLLLQRPDRVTWQVDKPARLVVSLGKSGVHIESGSGDRRSVQDFRMDQLPADRATQGLADMVAWLDLDAHALSQQYQVSSTGKRDFLFDPRPAALQRGLPFRRLTMRLASDGHLEHLTIDEVSDDQVDIEFGRPVIVKRAPEH